MQIISIDVGIKNLAYCIIDMNKTTDTSDNEYKIIKWDSINLCGEDMKCIVLTEKGIICNNKATYSKNNINYCLTHAKKSCYILPTKEMSIPSIKKLKLDNLISLAGKYNIHLNENNKKDTILKIIIDFISLHIFDTIGKTSANQLDLVTIGISMKNEFDKIIPSTNIHHVIIENQISPIANRMKTIQGMIAQYFIMKDIQQVSFISAMNKLKSFTVNNEKTEYKDRKKMSVTITSGILDFYNNNEWLYFFKGHKKKDDLADSFLQGIWFLKNQYNLKIEYKYNSL
jgi:hypothetical protein